MKNYTLEKNVFSYILTKKKLAAPQIVQHFELLGFTKQGIYKVLRKLHAEGKILWVKTHIEMHLLWLQQEIDQLATAFPRKEIIFQEFSEKKKVYTAKTLTELEQVYGQIFISLIASLHGQVTNFLFYDVHNYTYVNTVGIVNWYIDFIQKHKGNTYLLVGSTSPLDLALKKKNKMNSIHIHCADRKSKISLSIFGDYVISVTINRSVMEKIDIIFQTMSESNARIPLEMLYQTKSRHKIVVEKNPAKAREIEKEFRKYFHIKER